MLRKMYAKILNGITVLGEVENYPLLPFGEKRSFKLMTQYKTVR